MIDTEKLIEAIDTIGREFAVRDVILAADMTDDHATRRDVSSTLCRLLKRDCIVRVRMRAKRSYYAVYSHTTCKEAYAKTLERQTKAQSIEISMSDFPLGLVRMKSVPQRYYPA